MLCTLIYLKHKARHIPITTNISMPACLCVCIAPIILMCDVEYDTK